ncbi:MAG: hypothetical protein AABZ39_12775 [Spirochaetota bacterium]
MRSLHRFWSILLALSCPGAAFALTNNALPISVGEAQSDVSNRLAGLSLVPKSVVAAPSMTIMNYENLKMNDGIAKLSLIFKKSVMFRYILSCSWSNQNVQYYFRRYESQNSNLIAQQYVRKSENDDISGDTTNINRQTMFFREKEIAISILEFTEQRKSIYLVVEGGKAKTLVDSSK